MPNDLFQALHSTLMFYDKSLMTDSEASPWPAPVLNSCVHSLSNTKWSDVYNLNLKIEINQVEALIICKISQTALRFS